MQIEKQQNIKDTHNLVLQNIVQNQQVKFICFCKITNQKSIFINGVQNKFITTFVIAGRNFIRLFASFQNLKIRQLGTYKIHEDITNIFEWGKTIIVQTKHKIVGLIYEQQMLKNAFMVSLQFLPINSNDYCHCIPDKKGLFFVIQIKNCLLICLSNLIISSYQTKPFYKPNCQIITQDVKWNCQEEKPYVQQIIKIKLVDLEINFIYDISICAQSIYYTAYKSFQKPNISLEYGAHYIYRIPIQSFFSQKTMDSVFQFLTKKDLDVQHIYPYCFQRQIEYLYCKKDSLFIQNKDGMKMIQQFQDDQSYQILQKDQIQIFPLWIKTKDVVSVYLRKGFQIVKYQVLKNLYFQKMIVKHYKLALYNTMTQVCFLDIKKYQNFLLQSQQFLKAKMTIHKSMGSIIDFAIIKNNIYLVQNSDGKNCKFYQLKRQLSIDQKTYVLHSKKNKLQEILFKSQPLIYQVKSFRLPFLQGTNIKYQNYIVTNNKISFSIYKQTQNGFQIQMQNLTYFSVVELKNIFYFLTVNEERRFIVKRLQIQKLQAMIDQKNQSQQLKNREKQYKLVGNFNYFTKKWLVQQNLIYTLQINSVRFFNILTGETFDIQFQLRQEKLIQMFFHMKSWTLSENRKDQTVMEVTLVYQSTLQIYEIDIKLRKCSLIQISQNIFQGPPLLINSQVHKENIGNNNFKSITCPQYILSQYIIQKKSLKIVSALRYTYLDKQLLILINNQKQIMVYQKFVSFIEQTNFVFKRILLPLSIIKSFKWDLEEKQQICQIGEGIYKIGTIILWKGEFLQHQVNSKCYFQMQKMLWTLYSSQNKQVKIRMVDLKRVRGQQDSQVLYKPISSKLHQLITISSNFIKTPIRSLMKKQIVGLQTTNEYFIIYSKSGFQIINQKDFKLVWVQQTQGIIKLKAFGNLLAMSYYDQYLAEDSQYKSIKFKFRIYNILSKSKIIEKQKATDEPILHIKPIGNDKLILATSMTLFLCQIKNQKSLDIIKTKNYSKRGFIKCFSYIEELVSSSKPGYMLFGNRFGGLSFHVGKWVQQDSLRQFWYQQTRCHIREIALFHYGVQLKVLVADEDNNLIILNLKSDKFQKIADINVGSKVNSLKFKGQNDKIVYGCFQDGTIKSVYAVQLDNIDVSYLDFQEEAFCKQIPFLGGFNSRISRILNQQYRSYNITAKGNILDGQIIEQFFGLTSSLKLYLSQKSELDAQKIKNVIRSI